MDKIELYLVKSSSGSYDDYRESNEPIIYATLEAAEIRRDQIISSHVLQPFPFDWCTEQEFDDLIEDGKVIEEDLRIYDEWQSSLYSSEDFGSAWIQKVELDIQSWRERQLNLIDF